MWARPIAAIVGVYLLGSTVLCAATGIDICIPCIWESVFGFHCPGCGMTKAAIACLRLDFGGAWGHNPLVFIVVPIIGFIVVRDAHRFGPINSAQ